MSRALKRKGLLRGGPAALATVACLAFVSSARADSCSSSLQRIKVDTVGYRVVCDFNVADMFVSINTEQYVATSTDVPGWTCSWPGSAYQDADCGFSDRSQASGNRVPPGTPMTGTFVVDPNYGDACHDNAFRFRGMQVYFNVEEPRPPNWDYAVPGAQTYAQVQNCPPDAVATAGTILTSSQPQHVLAQSGVVVTYAAQRSVKLKATGTVSVPGAARVYQLRSVTREVAAQETANVKLRMGTTVRSAVRNALARHQKVYARVALAVYEGAQHKTTRLRIRLR